MTVKELWEFIKELVKAITDWVSDFTSDFLNIFFHKVSWMDSNVLIVASVLVAYGFLALWILGSTPVQYVLSADFRSERKAKKAQRIRDEEIARGEAKEREALWAEESRKEREENAQLWAGDDK